MFPRGVTQLLIAALFTMAGGSQAMASFYLAPYFTLRSTKSVDPSKTDSSQENQKIQQYKEGGIAAGVAFWRLFRTSLAVGQATSTVTEKHSQVVDEYDQIDFHKDLNMSTDQPDNQIKITDTQNRATFSLEIDPSFWIFILKAKVGVTAQQRIVKTEEALKPSQTVTKGPTYNPVSGVGVGVQLTPSMYFMVEYSAYHYKFPKVEPFERQLTVDYCVSI